MTVVVEPRSEERGCDPRGSIPLSRTHAPGSGPAAELPKLSCPVRLWAGVLHDAALAGCIEPLAIDVDHGDGTVVQSQG
jgi:hypothetical protein